MMPPIHAPMPRGFTGAVLIACLVAAMAGSAVAGPGPATPEPREEPQGAAAESFKEEEYSLHFQATSTPQGYPTFHAAYSGPNSLPRDGEARVSYSSTLFLGASVWHGGEVYADPEVFGGSGIGHGFGIAGYPNGDLNRVSTTDPRIYLARAFVRQTLELGGAKEKIEPDQNQLARTVDVSRITFTAGKLSAADIFDANSYSHDPRTQFMNWALFDNGAWDYPSDIRGYTLGGAVELNQPKWALRYGIFQEPSVASGPHLDYHIGRAFSQTAEYEQRYEIAKRGGKLRLLGFFNRAHMGDYAEAARLPPHDVTLTRRYSSKYGVGINLEQKITEDLGVFARLGWSDGRREDWAFTQIDRTASLGLSLQGTAWGRPEDTFGLAGVINGLSNDHRRYLESGGVGFIIGDGRLTYRPEQIIETYYSANVIKYVFVSADLQFVNHPAYNRDRGPVLVAGIRLHLQI